MTDKSPIDPSFLRGMALPRVSRRDFLRGAGATVGAVGLSAAFAACKISGTTPTGSPTAAFDWTKQKSNGSFTFANWPYYIDFNHGKRPSIDLFTKQTGISVDYKPVILENESFFAKIAPLLRGNQATGYDLMVLTNGFILDEIMRNQWLIPLDHSKLPNFAKYAGDAVKNPVYDPGNRFTAAWQSGLTGIGYNPDLTGREITSFDDLLDPAFKGKVGMFGDNLDLPNFTMKGIGIDPPISTPSDWQKAADVLTKQKASGVIRKYYTQDYIDALGNGDIAITMAWSGDIFQKNAENGNNKLKFVIPQQGAILWTDNMMIPIHAANPVDAITYMNFVYQPSVAAMIADWVDYICPVPDAQQIVATDLKDPNVANSPLVFPNAQDLSRTSRYRVLKPGEVDRWNGIFQPIYQG